MSKVTITLEDREGGIFVDVVASEGIDNTSHALYWAQALLRAIEDQSKAEEKKNGEEARIIVRA